MAGMSSAIDNRTLAAVAASVVGIALFTWLLWPSPPSDLQRVDELPTVPARLVPQWDATLPPQATEKTAAGDEILIYVDVSHSMAGFLPPPEVDPEGRSTLRTVAQLAPGHLLSTGAGTSRWYTVAEEVSDRPSPTAPKFHQSAFTGSASDLGGAVRVAIQAIEAGRARAALLITDLVATGDAKGAMGVGEPLIGWLESSNVQDGHFDLGVVGVRLPYWGAVTARCQSRPGLGCWYSEHADRYHPLTEVVERPLYFLLLGRTEGATDHPIDQAGSSLEKALDAMGLDARWELLTGNSRVYRAQLQCRATKPEDEERQYALYRSPAGHFTCRRSEEVALHCRATIEDQDTPLKFAKVKASWPQVRVETQGDRFLAMVDCADLRRTKPADDLQFTEIVVQPPPTKMNHWEGWSAASDEFEDRLTGTLQLGLFLDSVRLRPQSYELQLEESILKGSGS